jgi:hypothetical protein
MPACSGENYWASTTDLPERAVGALPVYRSPSHDGAHTRAALGVSELPQSIRFARKPTLPSREV